MLGAYGSVAAMEVPVKVEEKKPNIILIISDDVGFEEIGCYGVLREPSKTPRIDALAKQGVRFNTCYAQAICGPSRAMLYTGNYAVHNGQYDNKLTWFSMEGILPSERSEAYRERYSQLPCLTRVMKDAGYYVAWAGKWHHSTITRGYVHELADKLGIDTYMEWASSAVPFEKITGRKWTPDATWELSALKGEPIISRYWKPGFIHDGEVLQTTMEDYGPDMLTDFICEVVRNNGERKAPFFAMYAMNLAHSAHCVTPLDVEKGAVPSNTHIRKGTPDGQAIFSNQVRYMDQLVGQIVDTVEEAGLSDDTIIIYTSDNGTTSSAKAKGVEYGVHVPFVVVGPGVERSGPTAELMDFTDILPTLAEWAGGDLSKHSVDGISLAPFLAGATETTKPAIYSFPGPARLVRTQTHLLEAVCPLYNQPAGRLYLTHGSFDGRGYEKITEGKRREATQALMERLLNQYPDQLPKNFQDSAWELNQMTKAKQHFDNPKRKRATLSLPKAYRFYDESF
jgi:hypothetical protein